LNTTLIFEVSLADFLLITCALGAGAAFMTGRATALVWDPWWKLVVYVVLLCVALRFLHFSLFEGTFFLPLSGLARALYYYAVDLVILLAAAAVGRLSTRAAQMSRQYGFLFRRAGPIAWRRRA